MMRISVKSPVPDGPDAFVFERMNVQEELGRAYRYDVFVLSQNRDLALSPLLGQYATITVDFGSEKRYFGGHIARAAALGGHGRSARYQLELRPALYLLRDQAMCRIWQKTTILDVLKDVAKKGDVTLDVSSDVLNQGRQWEYVVQYRESDFNFFMRLVEQEGWHFFFKQEDGKHTLMLSDDLLLHESASKGREIEFKAESSAHEFVPDVFTHWTVREQMRPTDYELDDYDYKDARADMFVRAGDPTPLPKNGGKVPAAHPDRPATVFDYPGEYVDLYGGTELTMIRQQELRVDRQTASAQGNVRDLTAGSVFKLVGHRREGVDAQYAVTAMGLTVDAAAVESGKGGGEEFVFRGNYSLLSTEIPFRLKRTTAKPIIAGVQTAVVVGSASDEIHTDDLGRIRVKFRWDRTGKEKAEQNEGDEKAAAEDSSCWIRVAQPWASSGFGFQFIPRVGDEVVVQFLEGDPDRPLVTGSLYNSVNKFPFTLPGKMTQSGIKTRSSKKGGENNANIIRLEDDKGHEDFFVQAERNHTVNVKADRSVSVGGNETYNVKGKRDTKITKKNTDTYEDEHEMTVTKKVTEVFMDEHSLAVQKKQTVEVQNDKSEYIKQAYELTTQGKFLLTQGPGPNSGTTMKFEGNAFDMNVKGELTIVRGSAAIRVDAAGNVSIESPLSITLTCGPSKVDLGPAGVTVTGTMVKLNM